MNFPEDFRTYIREREGVRYKSYLDSLGYLTGGTGHLLKGAEISTYPAGTPIPEQVVRDWENSDLQWAWDAATAQAGELGITSQGFRIVLGSVNFQLGPGWRTNHPDTWRLMLAKDWQGAADSVMQSRWAQQTPSRAREFAEALINGRQGGGGSLAPWLALFTIIIVLIIIVI